jgi:hypothetical protein
MVRLKAPDHRREHKVVPLALPLVAHETTGRIVFLAFDDKNSRETLP